MILSPRGVEDLLDMDLSIFEWGDVHIELIDIKP